MMIALHFFFILISISRKDTKREDYEWRQQFVIFGSVFYYLIAFIWFIFFSVACTNDFADSERRTASTTEVSSGLGGSGWLLIFCFFLHLWFCYLHFITPLSTPKDEIIIDLDDFDDTVFGKGLADEDEEQDRTGLADQNAAEVVAGNEGAMVPAEGHDPFRDPPPMGRLEMEVETEDPGQRLTG